MGMVKNSQSYLNSNFALSLKCLKEEVSDNVDFLNADKHQSYLQVDFNTMGIARRYKVIITLLMSMIKHSQSTQSNKFAISLEYLKKENRNGVHFLLADKTSKLLLVGLLFLMKVSRDVQSTQNRKFVKFLPYIKKKYWKCFCVLSCKTFIYF